MNNLAFQIYGSTKSGIFQSTWDTTKTSTGSSASNQITLPLLSGGTYNFWIDWGDGSTTNVTSYSQRTHTYTSAGTYTLRATGIITGWGFQNTGDKLKILTISSWGKLKNLNQGFYGCSNLTLSGITDILDLTGTTSLGAMFSGCSKITTVGRMNEWDTSLITSMSNMFVACVLFNQPLNNWNTGNVTGFVNMFTSCYLFNQCIGSWNVTKCTSFEGMFSGCTAFNNGDNSVPLNNWVLNTTAASVSLNYTFLSCYSFNRYLGDWNTSKVNIMASLFSGCTVFNNGYASGVGNQLTWNTSACTNMSGMFQSAPAFNSNLGTGTIPWDVSKVTSFSSMFYGASNFNNGDDSAPINNWSINSVSSVSMNSMFMGASIFNRDISNWNMTKVVSFAGMFQSAPAFNQDLSTWNTGAVTTMLAMFNGASNFNNGYASGLAGTMPWNTGSCTNMTLMFYNAPSFNQDIGLFNVSKVVSFAGMFRDCLSYNNGDNINPINNWVLNTTVGANIDMSLMFRTQVAGTMQFNRQIDSWNVSEVTNMSNMFSRFNAAITSFNQPLANWERVGSSLAKVTNMSEMFSGSKLNYPIGNWNTSGVTNMYAMFLDNTEFNQDISTWDVSKVINMQDMFYGATIFNQPIGSWNINTTSNVSMARMFLGASAFNQNIGNWNVSQVTSLVSFMSTKTPSTYSSTNLDAIYNGWIVNGVKPNINISFGTAKYTAAGASGRLTLTSSPNNWIITDGGL